MNQNNLKDKKGIVQLRKYFHAVASRPPKYDIFNGAGNDAFYAWVSVCQSIEQELRNMGEVI